MFQCQNRGIFVPNFRIFSKLSPHFPNQRGRRCLVQAPLDFWGGETPKEHSRAFLLRERISASFIKEKKNLIWKFFSPHRLKNVGKFGLKLLKNEGFHQFLMGFFMLRGGLVNREKWDFFFCVEQAQQVYFVVDILKYILSVWNINFPW